MFDMYKILIVASKQWKLSFCGWWTTISQQRTWNSWPLRPSSVSTKQCVYRVWTNWGDWMRTVRSEPPNEQIIREVFNFNQNLKLLLSILRYKLMNSEFPGFPSPRWTRSGKCIPGMKVSLRKIRYTTQLPAVLERAVVVTYDLVYLTDTYLLYWRRYFG